MADKKEDGKLTNWQVPRSPEGQAIDALASAQPLDLNGAKYKDFAKVHEGDLQAAIDRTIAKQEAARGVKFDSTAPAKQEPNLKGINDERPKEYWTPPRIGRR